MAPQHLEYQQQPLQTSTATTNAFQKLNSNNINDNIGYAHKKFNFAAYRHKKFDSTFGRRSQSVESLNVIKETKLDGRLLEGVAEQEHQPKAAESQQRKECIFRPYALGENTPRKRKRQQHQRQHASLSLQQMRKLYQSEGVDLHLLATPASLATLTPATSLQGLAALDTATSVQWPAASMRGRATLAPAASMQCLATLAPATSMHGLATLAPATSMHSLATLAPATSMHGLATLAPATSMQGLPTTSTQQQLFAAPHSHTAATRPATYPMNSQVFAIMLQKQREALYMREKLQLHHGGGGLVRRNGQC